MYGLPYCFEIYGPRHYFQLIRSTGIAKEEGDVGLYVGLLVRIMVL